MIQHSGRESWSSCLLLRQIQFKRIGLIVTAPESSFEAADYELCHLNIKPLCTVL